MGRTSREIGSRLERKKSREGRRHRRDNAIKRVVHLAAEPDIQAGVVSGPAPVHGRLTAQGFLEAEASLGRAFGRCTNQRSRDRRNSVCATRYRRALFYRGRSPDA